jgi:hypothetical protein
MKGGQLPNRVYYNVDFKAKEPTNTGFAPFCYAIKDTMLTDSRVLADA